MPGWTKKIFIGLGILAGIIAIFLIFIHTPFARRKIADYAESYLLNKYSARTEIRTLDFRLKPPLFIRLTGVKVYGGPGNSQDFLTSRTLEVTIPYRSFWSDNFVVRRLTINSPSVNPKNLPRLKTEKSENKGTFQIDQVELTGGALRYAQFQVQDVALNAVVLPDSIQIQKLWARLRDFQMTASGAMHNLKAPVVDLNYRVSGNAKAISSMFPQAPALDGLMQTDGVVHGADGFYQINGKLDSKSLSVDSQPGFNAHADYRVDTSDKSKPYHISLTWNSLPLSIARKFSPQIPVIASISRGSLIYSGTENFWGGSATFETVLQESQKKGLPLAGRIRGELRDRAFMLDDSSLNVNGTRASFSGTLRETTARLKLNAYVPRPSRFAFLSPTLARVPGSYSIESVVHGPYQNLQIDFTLNSRASDFELVSNGTYSTGTKVFQAEASGTARASVLQRFTDTQATGRIDFDLSASGTTGAPVLHATVRGHALTLKNTDIGDFNMEANSNGKILRASAVIPNFSTTANGSYIFESRNFQLNAIFQNLAVDELRPFLPASASDLQGKLSGGLVASGNASRWRSMRAELSIQEAQLKRQGLQVAINPGSVVLLKNQIATINLSAVLPQGNLTVRGQVPISPGGSMDLRAQGQADLQLVSLFTNAVETDGDISMNITVRGSLRRPNVTGTIVSNPFLVKIPQRNVELTRGNLQADLEGNQANIRLAVRLNGSPFQAQGSVPLSRTGSMNLQLTGQADLKLLALVTDQIQGNGTVGVNVKLSGTVLHPLYEGSIRSDQFAVSLPAKNINLNQGRIAADFSGQYIRLNGGALLNGSVLQVTGTVPLTNVPGEVHLSLASFPVATLATNASAVSGNLTVKLDAKGSGIKPSGWSGLLTVIPENIQIDSTPVTSDQPVRVQLTSGSAELLPVHIQCGGLLDVAAQGKVDFHNGTIDARMRTTAELALLSRFTASTQASGALQTSLDIGGTLTRPDISGVVQLQNGVFRIPQSPVLLERIRLVAPIRGDRIVFEQLQAEMGGGSIRGGGTILLANWRPASVNLWIKANEVGMRYPEDLRSQINADLTFTGQSPKGYLLAGKVQISRSIFRQDIDPTQRLVNTLLSEKKQLSPPSVSETRIALNLSLDTLEDFQMRNNLGKLQAAANLKITGTADVPRISGRVIVREGSEITFQGNTFDVRRGNIDFYGQTKLDPVFDLELFTLATDVDTQQEYEVTFPLSGPLSNLDDRDPSSYPPLSPNQIYFLLLTGHAGAQVSEASSRFFQQQMASFIAGQAFSGLERQLASAFGLQRVEIQPETIASETSPGAKLVLGKDFSHSISLLYSVSLTEAREQTWVARYRTNRNFSFRFIDQQNEDYGANIRHLIRFGPGVSARSLRRPHSPTARYVSSIHITNQSPLPDAQVQKVIGLQPEEKYDFWNLQDSVESVKTKLQTMGYLFPEGDIEQHAAGKNSYNIEVIIKAREKRQVTYRGYQPTKHQLDKYRRFWREGFSEEGVLELIREDLLRGLWFQGYHQAAIRGETTRNGVIQHVFTITPGPLDKNGVFVFKGAKNYRPEELEEDMQKMFPDRKEMVTEAIHNFDSVRDKILALYLQKGYIDAQVISNDTKYSQNGSVQKLIEIDEGPQSKIREIVVTKGVEFPSDLQKKLRLKVGSVYDPQALNADQLTIGEYFEQKGYRDFEMKAEIHRAENGQLVLHYHIDTGGVAYVNSIQITGNRITDRRVIEQRLKLKSGDILTHEKLATAQKNLTDLRIFHSATVRAEETDMPDRYDVIVDVMEIKTYELQYGFRYDTQTSIGGEAQLTNINLFGTAQSASLYTRISKSNQLYRATYHSPTLAGLHWKNLISASYENGDLFLREADEFGLAEGQRFQFIAQRQRELWHPFILVLNYEFQRLRTRPAIAPPDFPFTPFKISLLGSQIFADTRDDPIDAHRGRFVSFDIQWSPTFLISDVNYVRGYAQYLNFKPLGRMLWASAVRLGLASHLDPQVLTERFLAGGAYTIRGFKLDQVGPKDPFGNPIGGEALFILNQEMRVPIYKWISGVAFYDGGNVYENFSDFNPVKLRHSIGFGLRVDSPFGIVRGDIGFNMFPRDNEARYVLHFGIGQAF